MSLEACDVWSESIKHDSEHPTRCPDVTLQHAMQLAIENARSDGDSLGGSVCVVARGLPAGLGEPVFDKLRAELGHALLSIPACVSLSFGHGSVAASMRGSVWNDAFRAGEAASTASNHHGGLLGGLSSGMPLTAHVGFHAPSSIAKKQTALATDGTLAALEIRGRHDPCVVPRAVPIVEAMVAIVLVDQLLRSRVAQITE